ncbi:MAG: methionyl-tRNA formyltransferase [Marinifilaceae bacterium]
MAISNSLRIIYMGTPDFAVLPLQRLIEAGANIVAVVTNPDKPAGRGQQVQESPVKRFAVEHNIPVLQPEKFRDTAFLEQLASYKADLQLVVAFKMLPEVVWNMPPMGTVNLHSSLLPDYRGAAPINWAVINGEKKSGVSTFLLKHEIDTGNIILQQETPITETMTAGELHDRLMEIGADLLVETVNVLEKGNATLKDQEGILQGRTAKHAPKIFKEDMRIDWNTNVLDIYNKVRGLSPYPAAWFELKDKNTEKIISAKLFMSNYVQQQHDKEIKTVETDDKTYVRIYVPGGYIELTDIQLAGKKRMAIVDLLRGFKIANYEII